LTSPERHPSATNPSNQLRYAPLGQLAEERGDLEQAVAWYRRITGDPEATEALGRLAEAGSISALGALRNAANIGDPEATEALRRLSVHKRSPREVSDDKDLTR
jgi:hypothetical protein